MATLIKENGLKQEIQPANGTDFLLDELKEYVDGYIEIISLENGKIMVINEEGKYTKNPNHEATQMAYDNYAICFGDYISGDVVICNDDEIQ